MTDEAQSGLHLSRVSYSIDIGSNTTVVALFFVST